MPQFASHCRVLNAVYYASQSAAPFPTPESLCWTQLLLVDTWTGNVPLLRLPPLPSFPAQAPRTAHYSYVATFRHGTGKQDFTALYFSAGCVSRSWFLCVVPPSESAIAGPFSASGYTLSPPADGSRQLLDARYFVFFGCPICGESIHKCGCIPLVPDDPDGVLPAADGTPLNPRFRAYLVEPVCLRQCPCCLSDMAQAGGTAASVQLSEFFTFQASRVS
jgi:hypothetical protein